MGRGEKVSGIILIGLALYYLYLSAEYPYMAAQGVPGPGMLPTILGICLFVLSLAYTVRSWLRAETKKKFWTGDIPALSTCLVFYLAYVVSIKWLGFLLANFFFGVITLKYLFRLRWLPTLFYSLILTVVFHIGFHSLLGVPLPHGLSWKILEALHLIG
jgi:hypothetical protein